MAIGIGHGKEAVPTVIGNHDFTATMVGDAGATPKLCLGWLVKSTTDDVIESDGYLSHGGTDGVSQFCQDVAVEDGVDPSIVRVALTNTNGGATTQDMIRLRRASNTSDVTNNDCALRFVSFPSAGTVRLNVRIAPPAGYYLVFLLIGGSDFTCLLDCFNQVISSGTPVDRTGLGVPADAALVYFWDRTVGADATDGGLHAGFWSASAHSGKAAHHGTFDRAASPPANQAEVRDDSNAIDIDGVSERRATLSQLPTGYRVTIPGGSPSYANQKCVVAMNFNKKRVAWAGVFQTPTALGAYSWKDPHLRPELAIAFLTRRPNVNAGDGAGSADSSVQGFAVWTADRSSALVVSQDDVVPTVAKMHGAARFVSIPREDGQLTGNPTTPAADDAVLADATQAAEGFDFTFTRTSSIARMVPMLVIGNEQTLVPTPALLGVATPAVTARQNQLPTPAPLLLRAPVPFIGQIRPTPAQLGIAAPSVTLDLPLPAMPGFEDAPPPPLADFAGEAMLGLLPRGRAWGRS